MKHLHRFSASLHRPPSAAHRAPGTAGPTHAPTFAVETRDHPSADELAARVRTALGEIDVELEVRPIFDSRDEALSRHFTIAVAGADVDGSRADLLDLGYDLADAIGARSAAVLASPPRPDGAIASAGSSGSSGPGDDGPATEPEWHLAAIRAERAWAHSRGAGVLIGQPDTGIADHHLLTDAVSRRTTCNLLERHQMPVDPLRRGDATWNPGHGTSTASVAASRGNAADRRIRGVAPEAIVLPVRCVESVILIDRVGEQVAEGIRRAVDEGARVVSLSLGGVGLILMAHVHAAIKYGAERGVVFVAAAGNGLGSIGGPATYPGFDYFCSCIAGSTVDDKGWAGSLGGPAVTVSAPAHKVWSAWREPGDDPNTATRRVGPGSGTTYATAIVGGVAALWIARHGHDALVRHYGEPWKVTRGFQSLLRATARVPAGWNHGYYGAGIVDAAAVVEAPLAVGPAMAEVSADDAMRANLRARLVDHGADAAVLARVDDGFLDRYGPELAFHLALAEQRRMAPDAAPPPSPLSDHLRAALHAADAHAVVDAFT
ncbi:MAG TPA: S8 family serine peptidase [Kofleriaceae bacterium]|nr:S8 family serine peptidase [Kofleriaceae bacterium]